MDLLDYWADFPPIHEIERVYVMATTTWKPSGEIGMLDPEARAANNRMAAMTTPGQAPPKTLDQLPPTIAGMLRAIHVQQKKEYVN